MRFAETSLFGVAPISVALRRIANHFGLLWRVCLPALFVFAVNTIVLSSIVLLGAH